MTCNNCDAEFEDAIYIPSPGSGDPLHVCPECESEDIEDHTVEDAEYEWKRDNLVSVAARAEELMTQEELEGGRP